MLSTFVVLLVAIGYLFYRRFIKSSLNHIAGPPSESWLYGNLPQLLRSPVGVVDQKWVGQYGSVVKVRGPLGQNQLLISDPKALQYIYQTGGYRFPKHTERRNLSFMSMGHGLTWAEGSTHKRQRKIMLPGFGAPETRAFLNIFSSSAENIVSQWHDRINNSTGDSVVIDFPWWLSRGALDALGSAAFDYKFGSLDNSDNELAHSYHNLFLDTFKAPSDKEILFISLCQLIPDRLMRYMLTGGWFKKLEHMRRNKSLATQVASQLVQEKREALAKGMDLSKDILSIMIQANAAEESQNRMSDEEIFSQMRTIILAGHETTANTLGWTFLELAKNPEIQTKLRNEIQAQKKKRKGDNWEWRDLEEKNMPYLNAVIKEGLRFHPILYIAHRQTGSDDIIPLEYPITTATGEKMDALPVPKGVKISISMTAYNRNKDVFGADADVFNPERWIQNRVNKESPKLGVYANLITFTGGMRACIGWRFAILEMQSFIVEIISNFELLMTEEAKRVRREPALLMAPVVEDQPEKGVQLPLCVTRLHDSEN